MTSVEVRELCARLQTEQRVLDPFAAPVSTDWGGDLRKPSPAAASFAGAATAPAIDHTCPQNAHRKTSTSVVAGTNFEVRHESQMGHVSVSFRCNRTSAFMAVVRIPYSFPRPLGSAMSSSTFDAAGRS